MILNRIPASLYFLLFYLPENPNIHSENPKADLIYLNEQSKDKSSSVIPWILFFGSILIFFMVRKSYLKDIAADRALRELKELY